MSRPAIVVALAVTIACALDGQVPEPAAAAARAPTPLLTLTIRGPAAFRHHLRPANLGSLLATEAGEALCRPWVDHFDALQRTVAGDERDTGAAAAARARLLDYAGALHVRVSGERARFDGSRADLTATLELEPDGRTDLRALAADLERWLCHLLGEHVVQDGELHLLRTPVALPRTQDGHLAIAAAAVPAPPTPAAASARPGALVALQLELPAAVDLLCSRSEERAWFRVLLGSAQTLRCELGADGPHVAVDARIAFAEGDRGLGEGLWPRRLPLPDLDWLVPKGAINALTSRIDAGRLWQCVLRANSELCERPLATLEQAADAAWGVSIARDLLAHVGDEMVLIWLPPGEHEWPGLLGGGVACVRLRDEAAFRASVHKAMPRLDWLQIDEDGDVLHATAPGFVTLHYAVGHDFLLVGVGVERGDLEALLDTAASPPAPTRPPVVARPGASVLQGRGHVDLVDLVATRVGSASLLLRSLFGTSLRLPPPPAFKAAIAPWVPLLQQHGLERAHTSYEVSDTGWHWRLLW